MKTFMRYLLFQIMGWILLALFLYLLVHRSAVPLWAAVGFFILWMVKDLALFPLVRSGYERDAKTGAERLIGRQGVVQQPLAPEGYIKIDGELWRARARGMDQTIVEGSPVRVRGARGLTLIVEEERGQRR